MESIYKSFPITLDAFDRFVTEAQKHIESLKSEAAKPSPLESEEDRINRLGKLIITFHIETVARPTGIEYLVEYEGVCSLRTVVPKPTQSGFRQTWTLARGDSMERYNFQEEHQKISTLIKGAHSHTISCTIVGYTLSNRVIRLSNLP